MKKVSNKWLNNICYSALHKKTSTRKSLILTELAREGRAMLFEKLRLELHIFSSAPLKYTISIIEKRIRALMPYFRLLSLQLRKAAFGKITKCLMVDGLSTWYLSRKLTPPTTTRARGQSIDDWHLSTLILIVPSNQSRPPWREDYIPKSIY